MSANTKNDEPKVASAILTPEEAGKIISSKTGTVEAPDGILPSSEEKADGVTSVEVANVSPTGITRPELLTQLSPGFKGAMVRLLHYPDGNVTHVEVETYFGNPIVDGKPVAFSNDPNDPYKSQSERHKDVFVFGSDGDFVGCYRETVIEDTTKPKDEIFQSGGGEPIDEDGLDERAITLISDLRACVEAGR